MHVEVGRYQGSGVPCEMDGVQRVNIFQEREMSDFTDPGRLFDWTEELVAGLKKVFPWLDFGRHRPRIGFLRWFNAIGEVLFPWKEKHKGPEVFIFFGEGYFPLVDASGKIWLVRVKPGDAFLIPAGCEHYPAFGALGVGQDVAIGAAVVVYTKAKTTKTPFKPLVSFKF